jgi:vesicle coat complex subunit
LGRKYKNRKLMATKKRFGFWGGQSQSAPTYTPSEKKGEISELRAQLRDPAVERDAQRRRDTLKKVIAIMTLGIDTSGLFTEMILACATKDIVQKKMVYFYLCSHAEHNAEIAILAINTLQKDCRDESPLVRGLALRALSSLRLPSIVEYLIPILKASFTDVSPYVRKTAILASAKLYKGNPETFHSMGLIDKLYGMIRDHDGIVCTNAIVVLQEVLRSEDKGGIQLNKSIVYFLLNRLRELNEWQVCLILQTCLTYTPASEDEMFDMMNLLEERLRGSNSAVILSSAHFFLNLTQSVPLVHRQVYERLKEPMLTILATAPVETSYVCLSHIKLLVQREPQIFATNYKDFFCRFNEPSFMKSLKLDVLVAIACEANAKEILTELVAYTQDTQVEVVRKSVRAICSVGMKVESTAKLVVGYFLDFLSESTEAIHAQTFVVLKDFLRKYTRADTVAPFFPALVKSYQTANMTFEDTETKVALVWIMGEFGEQIDQSPYILESFVDRFHDEPPGVRLEVLTACMKCFFKRPPEMQKMLGRLLDAAISDFSHADVHDRALMYYRLLLKDPQLANSVINVKRARLYKYVEEGGQTTEVKDKLFEEFNSLSVVLERPSDRFIVVGADILGEDDELEESEEGSEDEESAEDDEAQLLHAEEETSVTSPVQVPQLELDTEASIAPPVFQRCWSAWTKNKNVTTKIKEADEDALEEGLESGGIQCMATGRSGSAVKGYFYAFTAHDGSEDDEDEDPTRPVVLIELLMDQSGTITATLKTNASSTLLDAVGALLLRSIAAI